MSERRIAVISIIVEDRSMSPKINAVLSEYADFVVGRMGIPYSRKDLAVISVVVDAPVEVTNGITGKLGMIEGVAAKTIISRR